MKKYIVLSVNDNVDYLYFTQLTCLALRRFGWEPIVFYRGEMIDPVAAKVFNVAGINSSNGYQLPKIEGYRSDTITQISRLYGSCVADGYIMTGDIDMIPLSDCWHPKWISDGVVAANPTVWGHDLTGYGHYPICYIGMPAATWRSVMKISLSQFDYDYDRYIKRDLDTLPQAKDPDFYKYWFSDQDLITARLNEYGKDKITFINRGQYSNGFAVGRVDRGAWTLNHDTFIDAHLMQQTHHSQEKIDKLMELLRKVWPGEDFKWFEDYTREFKKLAV
jgi:hypothetical protein